MTCWKVIACVVGAGEVFAFVYFFCLNQQLAAQNVSDDQTAEVENEGYQF